MQRTNTNKASDRRQNTESILETNSSFQYNQSSPQKKTYNLHSIPTLESDVQTTTNESEPNVINWTYFYGETIAELFAKLDPHAKTPPRPIFNKETRSPILKEVSLSSSEYIIISSVLSKSDYATFP